MSISSLSDKSVRTSVVRQPVILFIIGSILLLISIISFPIQSYRYNVVKQHSSSPIGESFIFERSAASVSLKGVYTDKDRTALIARLSVDEESSSKLPALGKDYRVFIKSDGIPESITHMPVLFGRMSTDGDMFLIIPRPINTVYTVFIMNTRYLRDSANGITVEGDIDANDISYLTEQEQSQASKTISRLIKDYDIDTSKQSSSTIVTDTDEADMISFRMTINPSLKGDEYKVRELPIELLSSSNEFDFQRVFDVVFKQAAYQDAKLQHEKYDAIKSQLKASTEEYTHRLELNPDDIDATNALTTVNRQIEEIEQKQVVLAKAMNIYEQLSYDGSLFTNLQEEAKVVRNV